MRYHLLLLSILLPWFLYGDLRLSDNLAKAQPGDYIVTAQGKNYSLLLIRDYISPTLTIEEITVPIACVPTSYFSWKDWIANGAPGNTSWVLFEIDIRSGQMLRYFSFTKNGWYTIPKADNFLSTLLSLNLKKIPESARKRVGPPPNEGTPDWRHLWHPKMIVDGHSMEGVYFDGWKTHWPKDNSELSGRAIEIFIPREQDDYPSYFPYWLQISGMIGKAKIRIVDSGRRMHSPRPSLQSGSLSTRSPL